LSRVSNDARIDPVAFVTDVRQRARDSRSDLTPQERRDLFARADAHLARLHAEAEARGIAAGSGALYALSLEMDRRGADPSGDAEPDPDLDDIDDDDGEKPRRSIPRVRSYRRARETRDQTVDAVSASDAAATPKNRVIARACRPLAAPARHWRGTRPRRAPCRGFIFSKLDKPSDRISVECTG
jgi:hypothetical protein